MKKFIEFLQACILEMAGAIFFKSSLVRQDLHSEFGLARLKVT